MLFSTNPGADAGLPVLLFGPHRAFLMCSFRVKPTRQVEATKAAKLQAWLAIKPRFRGLTLGTVTRVSGRLLSLMVYELPQQPGNLR